MLDFLCKYEHERLRDDPGLYMDNVTVQNPADHHLFL